MQVNLHATHDGAGDLRVAVRHTTDLFSDLKPHGYVTLSVTVGRAEVVLFLSDAEDLRRLRDAAGEALALLHGVEAPVYTLTRERPTDARPDEADRPEIVVCTVERHDDGEWTVGDVCLRAFPLHGDRTHPRCPRGLPRGPLAGPPHGDHARWHLARIQALSADGPGRTRKGRPPSPPLGGTREEHPMKNKLILDPETGHDQDCLCVGCLAHRGGFTGEEYRSWVRDERTEGKAKLEAFSERHYATRRGEHTVTAEAPTGTSPANPGPTAPQADLIRRLVSERGPEVTGITDVEALLPTLTPGKQGTASALITSLIATPRPAEKPQVGQVTPTVPAGRYAITSGGHNDLAFYKVDHGKPGTRWEGYVFVAQLVGGGREYAVKDRAARSTILGRIAEDVETASRTYGREYGHCGVCNLPLTDETSRAAGIGPICLAKQGW